MSQEQKPIQVNTLEIKNIQEFKEEFTTFSKKDLRVVLLDQENKSVYIPLSEIDSGGSEDNVVQSITGEGVDNTDELNPIIKNYIKSNESLENARRKDDILYGIIDQYTGEDITLSKVIGNPIVDNIIYFQLGSEYFKRNNIRHYNVKWFGAKGDGITDDTENIQLCVNKVFELGGGVIYFPISIYIVSGPLKNNIGDLHIDYNSQIYIPTEGTTFENRKSIKFLGEVSPNLTQSAGIGNAISPNTGVIIRSTIQGSGVLPSVIAGRGGGFFLNFSYTSFFCENIAIQVTPNNNNKITIGGFNFKDCAIANFEYVSVYPYNLNLVNSGRPDVIEVCGIHMPAVNNEHICTLNKVTVGGFTNGYIFGEHTSAYDAVAVCCVNAFNQQANFHLGNYNKLSSFWCENDFVVSGASRFIVNIQTENIYKGKWYDNKSTINDLSNAGRGIVNYNLVREGVGIDNSIFIKKGGYYIKAELIGVNPVNAITGTSATLKIGDGDLDLLITTNNSPVSITVPDITSVNFDVGTTIRLAQYGNGQITLIPGSGVTLNTLSTLKTKGKFSVIYLTKQYDNDWVISGDLEPNINSNIHIVPSGNFTVPNGSFTKMITLTAPTSQTVTLPAISDAIGAIYFITNASSDGISSVNVVSKTGSSDFWDGGTSGSSKALTFGMSLRFFNDGTNFKIIG